MFGEDSSSDDGDIMDMDLDAPSPIKTDKKGGLEI